MIIYVLSIKILENYISRFMTNILCTGSILSNNNRIIKRKELKFPILYISTYRKGSDNEIFLQNLTTNKEYREKEIKLIKLISTFAKMNKLAFYVLGAKNSSKEEEKEFYINNW